MPRFRDLTHTSKPSDAPRVVEGKIRERTVDPAALAMLEEAKKKDVVTTYDRFLAQQPQCKIGYQGICCRICLQGPCRVKPGYGPGSKGICGASAYTIVARNLVRLIAGGAAAHSDHGKHIAKALFAVAEGKAPDYSIVDKEKLYKVAERIGIDTKDKSDLEIAKELAIAALEDYSRLDDEVPATWVKTTVTEGRNEKFISHNIMPYSINGNIVELISGTHMGMDADPVNLIFHGLKVALSDYAGEHIGTDFSDIIFGTPQPVVSEANLGVLDENKVNIAVHGHNPLLSEIMVKAAQEMEKEAVKAGAKGINLVGICCTGNEVLMRQGVPLVTSFASQELAIMTGALDAMVVDLQCIMPSIRQVAECFHTKIVTTQHHVKIPGAYHFAFHEDKALDIAKEVIRLAIHAFTERNPNSVNIPQIKNKVVAGFSTEAFLKLLASLEPDQPIKVVTEAILSGELKGVALLCGCNNLKGYQDYNHLTIAKELAQKDVLLLATGCSAQAFAKHGLLDPEAVEKYAGPGLRKFLYRLNQSNDLTEKLPLIFHMGSCVDNSRVVDIYTMMANQLGVDIPKVPFVASAPEAMSEKAVAIGSWNVAMGIPTHVGTMPPIEGSELIYGIATQIASDVFGGYFIFETDPKVAAKKLLSALEYRTWKLGVHREAALKYGTDLSKAY
ncbi:anaerobic carbon-monoxide dehydrogenase catalytic subunit [Zhaonella formicivorans]|uniref:anaerobic carbon-monoxide dehydrogenase catalytic subunit n=1 Tax=Zhaonella formicivorans TaxID=2528593 RepID=UPI001D0FDC33|nr:anaerobic carbon-monoxide dehydrogenase catalytic subunit [Zhaonella formicivorans]